MFKPTKDLTGFDIAMGGTKKLSTDFGFCGPLGKEARKITDPLYLIMILLTWSCALYVGTWSIANGNDEILTHPTDYRGRLCGKEKSLYGGILPRKLHVVDTLHNGVCVDDCPLTNNFRPIHDTDLICKDETDLLALPKCRRDDGSLSKDPNVLLSCGGCFYQLESSEINNRCIPKSYNSAIIQIKKLANDLGIESSASVKYEYMEYHDSALKKVMSDMKKSQRVIMGVGFGGSIFWGIILFFLVQVPPTLRPVIYIAVFISPVLLAIIVGVCFSAFKGSPNETTESRPQKDVTKFRALVIAASIASVFSLCASIYIRRQTELIISMTSATNRAVKDIKYFVFYPFIQLFFYALFLFAWGECLFHTSSTIEKTKRSEEIFGSNIDYVTYTYKASTNLAFGFLVFAFFWTSEFIFSLGQMTLSLGFSKWYFTINKYAANDISLIECIETVLLKHAGTAAFSSLIWLPIGLIRQIIALVQYVIKKSNVENIFTDMIVCSCQCCLFLQERFLKYPSKKTYVQTSLFGHSFCKGSHESFFLTIRNTRKSRSFAPYISIATVLFNISALCLIILCSYLALDQVHSHELFSISSVLSGIAVIAWYVLNMFTGIYSIGNTTMMHCLFVADEILGDMGSYYIPNEVNQFLHNRDEELFHISSPPHELQSESLNENGIPDEESAQIVNNRTNIRRDSATSHEKAIALNEVTSSGESISKMKSSSYNKNSTFDNDSSVINDGTLPTRESHTKYDEERIPENESTYSDIEPPIHESLTAEDGGINEYEFTFSTDLPIHESISTDDDEEDILANNSTYSYTIELPIHKSIIANDAEGILTNDSIYSDTTELPIHESIITEEEGMFADEPSYSTEKDIYDTEEEENNGRFEM